MCGDSQLLTVDPYERLWCDLPAGHRPRWHAGYSEDGTRWTWWGVGCALPERLPRQPQLWSAA